MIIGAYFTDGTVLVAPLEQAAQLMHVSEHILKQTMEGKYILRDVVITKLPPDACKRIPKEVPEVR